MDGLHQRAGLAPERCFAIHGNIDQMRCSAACGVAPQPLPEGLSLDWPRGRRVTEEELARLCCSSCGAPCRPQLLWFDERYDEEHFRIESTLIAATGCQLLIIAGSSGTTNLPLQIAALAHQREIPILVIDPEPGPFTRLAEASEGGHWLRAPASAWVPALCEALG